MIPLYGHTDVVTPFVASLIPGAERGFGNCSAIGVLDETHSLVAGIVYHNWSPEAQVIEMSAASLSPRWLTRQVLRAMFDFPFRQLDCQMVVLRVSERNQRMRSICRRFGFDEYIIPRLRGRNEAETIQTLTLEQWSASKLLGVKDG